MLYARRASFSERSLGKSIESFVATTTKKRGKVLYESVVLFLASGLSGGAGLVLRFINTLTYFLGETEHFQRG